MTNEVMILLTPVLVFFIVLLVGFVGCGSFLPSSEEPLPDPEPEPDPTPKPADPFDPAGPYTGAQVPYLPPVKPKTYEELVTGVKGFAAFWPLNEMSGKFAAVVGPLSPGANGTYVQANGADPGVGSYTQGKEGVLFTKDPKDFAVEFTGTEALIEVPFHAQLNTAPAFTVEVWAKPNPAAGADRGVLVSSHHFESATKEQGYEVGLLKVAGQPHHQIYARVYSGTGAQMTEITVQPDQGDPAEWRHIVFRYGFVAGQGTIIHLRAQLLKSATVFENNLPASAFENVTSAKPSTLRLAGSHLPGGGAALFAGRLDNVAIYNEYVADKDIDAHFGAA
jgi:hypothetical protein